jgi:hypothetical protein
LYPLFADELPHYSVQRFKSLGIPHEEFVYSFFPSFRYAVYATKKTATVPGRARVTPDIFFNNPGTTVLVDRVGSLGASFATAPARARAQMSTIFAFAHYSAKNINFSFIATPSISASLALLSSYPSIAQFEQANIDLYREINMPSDINAVRVGLLQVLRFFESLNVISIWKTSTSTSTSMSENTLGSTSAATRSNGIPVAGNKQTTATNSQTQGRVVTGTTGASSGNKDSANIKRVGGLNVASGSRSAATTSTSTTAAGTSGAGGTVMDNPVGNTLPQQAASQQRNTVDVDNDGDYIDYRGEKKGPAPQRRGSVAHQDREHGDGFFQQRVFSPSTNGGVDMDHSLDVCDIPGISGGSLCANTRDTKEGRKKKDKDRGDSNHNDDDEGLSGGESRSKNERSSGSFDKGRGGGAAGVVSEEIKRRIDAKTARMREMGFPEVVIADAMQSEVERLQAQGLPLRDEEVKVTARPITRKEDLPSTSTRSSPATSTASASTASASASASTRTPSTATTSTSASTTTSAPLTPLPTSKPAAKATNELKNNGNPQSSLLTEEEERTLEAKAERMRKLGFPDSIVLDAQKSERLKIEQRKLKEKKQQDEGSVSRGRDRGR